MFLYWCNTMHALHLMFLHLHLLSDPYMKKWGTVSTERVNCVQSIGITVEMKKLLMTLSWSTNHDTLGVACFSGYNNVWCTNDMAAMIIATTDKQQWSIMRHTSIKWMLQILNLIFLVKNTALKDAFELLKHPHYCRSWLISQAKR